MKLRAEGGFWMLEPKFIPSSEPKRPHLLSVLRTLGSEINSKMISSFFCFRAAKYRPTLLIWLLAACVGVLPQNGLGAYHGKHYRVLIECPVDNDQLTAAKRAVESYRRSVAAHRRHRAHHRYIAVRTRNPNNTQKTAYLKKRAEAQTQAQTHGTSLSPDWVDPENLKCVCVFDTLTEQFTSSKCYVVGDLPTEGDTAIFQTYTTEYVGTGAGDAPKVEPLE